MWKPAVAFLAFMMLLGGAGLVAGRQVFAPWERVLSPAEPQDPSTSALMSPAMDEKQYKKIRLAFNSFDLAGGLTRSDWEAIPSQNTFFFAFLLVCVGILGWLKKPES